MYNYGSGQENILQKKTSLKRAYTQDLSIKRKPLSP
jgi:hypothetical protein